MRRRLGHTLIELLLAVSISGLVLTAVYSSLSLGIKVFRRAKSDVSVEAQTILDKVSHRLRSAYLYPDTRSDLIFLGSPQSLRFIAVEGLQSPTASQDKGELRMVRYYLVPSKKRRLSSFMQSVHLRTGQKEDQDETRSVMLSDAVANLKIDYFDGENWSDFWNSGQQLPRAVRIVLMMKQNPREEFSRSFSTIIDLPVKVRSSGADE